MYKCFKLKNLSRGITMIENLVALLILSIGLLGLAGLQAATLRNSTDASFRSTAVQQATDMINRIIVNTNGATIGVAGYFAIPPAPTAPSTFCDVSFCSGAQLANFDAWEWNTANAKMLPGGGGTVVGIPLPLAITAPSGLAPVLYTVTVRWDANRSGVAGLGCVPSIFTDLKCVTLQVIAP